MKVSELIGRLREFEPQAEVRLQLDSRDFAPPGWVGIMDTAGMFDEERNPQLVIASWEPEEHLKPASGPAAEEREEVERDMKLARRIMHDNRKALRALADAPPAVQHPPTAILGRIVKAEGNLQLDYWERFTFLLWLYLAYNPDKTAGALEATVEKQLAANRLLAAVEGVFAGPAEALAWLDDVNAGLEGSRPIEIFADRAGERRVTDLLNRIGEQLSPEKRDANITGWADSAGFVGRIWARIAQPSGDGGR